MIDLTKLSREEFIQLEKEIGKESRRRKNDYSGDLPVVTSSIRNEQTLWYENFVDSNRESYDNDGIKTLSISGFIKKEVHPLNIEFHARSMKCDKYCKYGTYDKFVSHFYNAQKYIAKRINMAVGKEYTAYHTVEDGVDIYRLYFIIEYTYNSYASTPYQYHQIISIRKHESKYDSMFALCVEQHKAVGGFSKFELPPNDAKCHVSEFDSKLGEFYGQVYFTLKV